MKRSELRPDPDKVRDWIQRSRQPLKRTQRKTRAKLSPAKIREVNQRSRGRCIVCGSKRMLQRHHVLPVQRWPQYETQGLNLVLVCAGCHDEHERAHRRIPYGSLPKSVRTWIRTLGGRETLYMERTYPR